jgi:uncharacterized paraquat-inducible protein A
VRKLAVAALALLAASLALALVARFAAAGLLDPLAGVLFVASLAAAVGLLPLWDRLRAPPMPGLFARPAAGQRWCAVCGRPAPPGTCPRCRTAGRRSRRDRRSLQRN